jgi:8-oxo-dGTP pyrophosphatase MutT (NUDIX family)
VGVLTHLLAELRYPSSPLAASSQIGRRSSSPAVRERLLVAAVCYRLRRGEPEFLLVRTRNGHWTFPKGGMDRDATPAHAAAREAYEEAGVKGSVHRLPFTCYRHPKVGKSRSTGLVATVHAHLCEVKQLVTPSEDYRTPTWFGADKAKRRLQKSRASEFSVEIASVIDQATLLIRRLERSSS